MENKILIVYYTYSKNTEKTAQMIADKTGGELLEIKPEKDYPSAYALVVAQAKIEILRGFSPKLKTEIPNLENYDTIFIGTPNWWSTMAPPVKTFLKENDLAGKKIVPFYTHGGGGAGHIVKDMKELCPKSQFLKEFGIYESGNSQTEKIVSDWVDNLRV